MMTMMTVMILTSAAAGADPPVLVVLDMDAAQPGAQPTVTVTACTAAVFGVSVRVIDPTGARLVWSVGYLGGIDRGISFGHVPDPGLNSGCVTGLSAEPVAPVNPGNTGWIVTAPGLDPGFAGPEVQYVEFGAEKPSLIDDSGAPLFAVMIELAGARPGDRYRFHLLDKVAVWAGGGGAAGAFSTTGQFLTLDTGGDSVPDGTDSIHGIDADIPVPVPPAAFLVDYVDGPAPSGPATIEIVAAPGDLDADGAIGISDLLLLLGAWGACEGPPCPGDLDGDGAVGIADLLSLLANWGGGCECP